MNHVIEIHTDLERQVSTRRRGYIDQCVRRQSLRTFLLLNCSLQLLRPSGRYALVLRQRHHAGFIGTASP